MRRSTRNKLVALSFAALGVLLGACAKSTIDDDWHVVEQDPTAPEDESSNKLPSNAKDEPADAGADSSSSSKDKDPPQEKEPEPSEEPEPLTGGDCDISDLTYYFKFLMTPAPSPCPCVAAECCYMQLGCIAK